jgi:hypothetical protein
MERDEAVAWLAAYRRAWELADPPAVVALFTVDARYRSHPLRPAHAGHDGVAAYWAQATADQRDVRVRFGTRSSTASAPRPSGGPPWSPTGTRSPWPAACC